MYLLTPYVLGVAEMFSFAGEAAINYLDKLKEGGGKDLVMKRRRLNLHGGLLPGITIEKIKSGFSQPRNTLIANVFYHCNLIEKWGRGIPEITHSCIASGDPEPESISDEESLR